MTIQYSVYNRFTRAVQFMAEIDCADSASQSAKLGLAVRWAIANGAKMRGADLRDADLSGADMSGADLSGADMRDANMSGADMSGADLSGADMRDANMSGADMRDADMSGAKMSGADLSGADMRGANMRGANMRDADLSGAVFDGVPIIPNIHASVYQAATARPELFDMGDFATDSGHTCDTAQCRAGWVLAVAGQAGLELEAKIGTPAAAMAIYIASDPDRWKTEPLPDFYTDEQTALADMKRMAGL